MAKIAATQKNGQGRRTVTGQRELTSIEKQQAERLAYQFFVDRGFDHGHDQEDWLKAESIIRNRRS